jgi:dolichol-phosphate mannosyltransferase
MIVAQQKKIEGRNGSVSLVLPLAPGRSLAGWQVAECRRILEDAGHFEAIEVVVARGTDTAAGNGAAGSAPPEETRVVGAKYVSADGSDWSALVRAGLRVATGDRLVVLDVGRRYRPEALRQVVAPVRTGPYDLAVAIAKTSGWGLARWTPSNLVFGLISRLFLGTSDVFSGLFALDRSVWERAVRDNVPSASRLVLDALLRRPARCIDVPVAVDDDFRARRFGLGDVRPIKHLLDSRFGNYSRLVQFCMVGASGMFVDLTTYAMLQWLLAFTVLAERQSALFGCPWHLAGAAALAISTALVWNFTLNRRLTFNDARKGSILRQFLTYALSNGLAIALSFSVRLYLPTHVAFFARHRLAAAVVGIVAATAISFSMARWLVFARRPDAKHVPHFLADQPISQPSSVT